MHQHDECSSTDVVNTPGEADEEDCCYMVDDLLLEVLNRKTPVNSGELNDCICLCAACSEWL